jgi:hypothetical protein
MIGKCPVCGAEVRRVVTGEAGSVFVGEMAAKAFTFSCAECGCVLGCQVDPCVWCKQVLKDIVRGMGE